MKGYKYNIKDNVEIYIDDDTPFPTFPEPSETHMIDLRQLMERLDRIIARLERLEELHR